MNDAKKKIFARTWPGLAISILLLPAALLGCATSPARSGDGVPGTVRAFLDSGGWDLSAYENSEVSDLGRYYRHVRRYAVNAPADLLWSLYTSADPRDAWRTERTRFGVVWDPVAGRLFRKDDEGVPRFAVGQVYALELEVAGFLRMPVAFRITEMDGDSRTLEFVYLKRNKSNGLQRISFHEAVDSRGEPFSVIEHSTWYKSGARLRDKRLYARFHSAIIDGFHQGMARAAGYVIKVLKLP